MREYAETERWTLSQGDVLKVLHTFPSETVQCVVPSPPYCGIRDYGLPQVEWSEVDYSPMDWLPPITFPGLAV